MRLAAGMLSAWMLWAGGLDPRPSPKDYPAEAKLAAAALGAEYLARGVAARGRTFLLDGYLVIETAMYPERGRSLAVSAGHFTLRVNGKKAALAPQTPGMVAASLKYPDWERRPELTVGGGVGDAGVIIGGRRPGERFPGDPRPRQTRLPEAPRVPAQTGVDREPAPSPEEVVVEAALPEGETAQPVAGLLYFAYRGKTKGIRSLELLYNGPAGQCALRLF
jgi:hypothetical protein